MNSPYKTNARRVQNKWPPNQNVLASVQIKLLPCVQYQTISREQFNLTIILCNHHSEDEMREVNT